MSSDKLKVVVTRNLGEEAMKIITDCEYLDIVVWPENSAAPREWVLSNLKGAIGVSLMHSDKVNAELLDAAGDKLKVVSTLSVGYEHVVLKELAKRGIRLGYTPDVLTEAVADITVMLAFMASRNVGEAIGIVQAGKWATFPWDPFAFTGPQLSNVDVLSPRRITAGFLGFGRIAQATLHRLIPFGFTDVLFTSGSRTSSADYSHILEKYAPALKSLRRASMEEVAVKSDVVFVLTPGGAETYHLVDERFLKGMKKSAVLVNTSRGTVVDSEALAKALREGWIWGAGLDVIEGEPKVGVDHPLVKEPRAVILPHIGSASIETRIGMTTRAARNLVAGVLGEKMDAEVDVKALSKM